MPTTIKASISPYGSFEEKLWVGNIVGGEFVKDKKYKSVLDDSRLKTKRTYGGSVGMKPNATHYYTIEVPDDYPQAIAKRCKVDIESVRPRWEYTVLYPA